MKYQAYDEYKDSGSEWLGVVPDHWLSKKLKYILAPKGLVRGPFGSALKKNCFSKSGIKVYEQKNAIKGDCYIGDSYIDENRYRELDRFTVQANDVIMSCSGTIGRTVRVPDDSEKGIINQALLIIRMDNSISDGLFDYLFDSDGIKQQIIDNSIGGAMQNLVATDIFKGIRYPIPPIEEQQKIANFLDHETAKIDTLIEKQQQLIKLLKEKRQTVISHAVTKGLNPNAPMRDSGVEWLGEAPEDWVVTLLKRFCNVTDGSHYSPAIQSSGKPFISVTDVGVDTIDFDNCKRISNYDFKRLDREGCKPKVGEVLLTKDGTIGRAAIVKDSYPQFVILSSLGLLSPSVSLLNNYWLF